MLVFSHSLILLTADCVLQQTIANAEQINDIEERIESLGEILAFPVGDWDAEEKARRTALKKFVFLLQESVVHLITFLVRRKLVKIIAKLGSLSEKHGLAKFLNNADHANTLNSFVQDLAYAVTDYQVCCACTIVRSV